VRFNALLALLYQLSNMMC